MYSIILGTTLSPTVQLHTANAETTQSLFSNINSKIRPGSSDACVCGTQVYQPYPWSTVPHNIPKQLAH